MKLLVIDPKISRPSFFGPQHAFSDRFHFFFGKWRFRPAGHRLINPFLVPFGVRVFGRRILHDITMLSPFQFRKQLFLNNPMRQIFGIIPFPNNNRSPVLRLASFNDDNRGRAALLRGRSVRNPMSFVSDIIPQIFNLLRNPRFVFK